MTLTSSESTGPIGVKICMQGFYFWDRERFLAWIKTPPFSGKGGSHTDGFMGHFSTELFDKKYSRQGVRRLPEQLVFNKTCIHAFKLINSRRPNVKISRVFQGFSRET